MKLDLHTHTNASDGELSPKGLVDKAVKEGLKALAITDHDSIKSVKEAVEYGQDRGIEVIPGIEISCYEKENGYDEVHIVGLYIDYENNELKDFTERIKKDRVKQKKQIIENLKDLGYEIDFEDVKNLAGFSVGRPHIAKTLIKKYPDKFSSVSEVFDKLIANGKPAYAEREFQVKIDDAIRVIKNAGGVTFLAHPGIYDRDKIERLVDIFIEKGGEGIETIYPYEIVYQEKFNKIKSEEEKIFLKELAKKRGLLESCGTDFHGDKRCYFLGLEEDENILEKIRKN